MTRPIVVNVRNNSSRKSVTMMSSATPRQAFAEAGINANGIVNIDGCAITIGDLDRSFDELGIVGDETTLYSVVKADNA